MILRVLSLRAQALLVGSIKLVIPIDLYAGNQTHITIDANHFLL